MILRKTSRLIGICVLACVLITSTTVMASAEVPHTAKEYMKEGIRAAYDKMCLIYQAFYDDDGKFERQLAGHVAIWQERDDEGNLISRTFLGPDGEPVDRIDGYCKVDWSNDGAVFHDTNGNIVPIDGINLARDVKVGEDGWSEWMKPKYDALNSTFRIGYTELGEKREGTNYTCSLEIEYRDVTATQGTEDQKFCFRTQGATDGQWIGANVWNSKLVYLDEPIENGIKRYVATVALNENGANATHFDLDCRCDYWASGEFRVRNVKVEHGTTATDWSPPE